MTPDDSNPLRNLDVRVSLASLRGALRATLGISLIAAFLGHLTEASLLDPLMSWSIGAYLAACWFALWSGWLLIRHADNAIPTRMVYQLPVLAVGLTAVCGFFWIIQPDFNMSIGATLMAAAVLLVFTARWHRLHLGDVARLRAEYELRLQQHRAGFECAVAREAHVLLEEHRASDRFRKDVQRIACHAATTAVLAHHVTRDYRADRREAIQMEIVRMRSNAGL